MKGPGKIHGLFFFRGNFKFSFVKIYMEKSKHLCYDVKDEIDRAAVSGVCEVHAGSLGGQMGTGNGESPSYTRGKEEIFL